jgi:hypothetical protein
MVNAYSSKVELTGVRPYAAIGKNSKGEYIWSPLEMSEEELDPKHDDLRAGHRQVMEILTAACNAILEKGARIFPITRNEMLKWGATKKDLKDVESMGLVKHAVVRAITANKVMTGARNVVCFTAQGRAYVRKHIDPEFGRRQFESPAGDKPAGEDPGRVQPESGAVAAGNGV